MTENPTKLYKHVDNNLCQCYDVNDKKSCQNDKRISHDDFIVSGKGDFVLLFRGCRKKTIEGGLMEKLYHLKEYRGRLGITQAEMGLKAGVARSTISRIEQGTYTPSVTLAIRLADICQTSVEDIFPRLE